MYLKLFLLFVYFNINLFAYEKYTDSRNVYFESVHFKAVAGVEYKDAAFVESIAVQCLDAAEHSWNKIVDEYGFLPPRNSMDSKINIYIANLNTYDFQNNSYVTISSSGAGVASYYDDGTPFFKISRTLTSDEIKVTIAHEFFHTVQYAYTNYGYFSDQKWRANIWWLEATAMLMEDEVYDDINDYIYWMNTFFRDTTQRIDTFDGSHEYSMVVFAKFIKEFFGMEFIKDVFSNLNYNSSYEYLDLIGALAYEQKGIDLKTVFGEFAKWVANAPLYFEEGILYPDVTKYNKDDVVNIEYGGIKVIENNNTGWSMTALSSIILDEQFDQVWTYSNNNWKTNVPNDIYDIIDITNSSEGYWKYSNNQNLAYTYLDLIDSVDFDDISFGWTLLSNKDDIVSLSNIQDTRIKSVWYFNDGRWYMYSSLYDRNHYIYENNNIEYLDTLMPHISYWIYKE